MTLTEAPGFSSYAYEWIKRSIQKCLNGEWAGSLPLGAPVKKGSEKSYQDDLCNPEPLADEALAADPDLSQAFHDKLVQFRQTLNAKELDILETRILTEGTATLKGIASRHGVSSKRVRQIEDRLIKKLRHYMQSQFSEH